MGRRGSYVNIDRALMVDTADIVEDFDSGDSGSTKNAKKVQPIIFQGLVAANSAVELGQNQPSQISFTEDVQNSLHEEIRAG